MHQNVKVRDQVMLRELGNQGGVWGFGDSGESSDQVLWGDT